MPSYVNRDAIKDSILPMEVETDPLLRIDILKETIADFHDRVSEQVRRTCLELKVEKNWSTGQIAEATGLSERMVKRMITKRAEETSQWNPLRHRGIGPYIDISDLVRRERSQSISGG